MGGWSAFRRGLGLARRYPRLLVILYAANLLAALLLAALPALVLTQEAGHRPAIAEAADGLDAWLWIETLVQPQTGQDLAEGTATAALLVLLLAVALPFAAWLPAAFLNGGLLLTYHEAPAEFRWRRFLWGGWHWWGTFLVLGLIQALGAVLTLGALAAVAALLAGLLGSWVVWPVAAAGGLAAFLGLGWAEWARIVAVAEDTRNPLQALGRAARFLRRRPGPAAGLYGLSLLLAALLHAIYRLGLMPLLPLEKWLLVLAVQQSFVLGRLAIRLARLAGGTALLAQRPPPPPP
jgi:hypothetical protein